MELSEFVAVVPGFDALAPRDKILHFGWFLHVHRGMQTFATGDIRRCYEELHLEPPNIAQYLGRLAETKPRALIKSSAGYKLERRIRNELDASYALHPTTIAVSKLLSELPAKVPDLNERAFLQETLKTYHVGAFRSAVAMAWNLTYDHLIRWILADAKRLAEFNAELAKKYPKKNVTVTKLDDFIDQLKERETIEACTSKTGGIVNDNIVKILREKLDRRNRAAHPSPTVFVQSQADDAITDLVNNVVLELK